MNAGGQLVVLEGPDGVGKSTLAAGLVGALKEAGVPCMGYAFPGNESGTIGALVYRLHHEPDELGVRGAVPMALQAMHVAAHIDAIERVVRPKLDSGATVVLDRFWWSTWVYGCVAGIPRRLLERLIAVERLCWGTTIPAIAFLVDRERPLRPGDDTPTWPLLAREYRALAGREISRHRVDIISAEEGIERNLARMTQLVLGRPRSPATGVGAPELQPTLHLPPHPDVEGGRRDGRAPSICVSKVKSVKATAVFDSYWRFAAERQNVFFRRLEGSHPPWSDDPILQRYRFTNAYRASDRVSQHLIRHVLYGGDQRPAEIFFRAMLFKLFNRIETWRLLERSLGEPRASEFDPDRYERVLSQAMGEGQRIYSPAYIMPAAPGTVGRPKHAGHLRLLHRMLRDELPRRLADASSLREAFELLRSYPMMGDFLAFQYVIDLNYSTLLKFSEMEFVVPGPGARSGIRKCFRDLGGLSESDVIRLVTEGQEEEFRRRGIDFRDLWGRPLHLIDCQNLFCEVDKYARVAHPEAAAGGRTRIKQVFRPVGRISPPWFPPKWNINQRIPGGTECI